MIDNLTTCCVFARFEAEAKQWKTGISLGIWTDIEQETF